MIDIQYVGKNSGWVSEALNVPGKRMKRARMAEQKMRKSTISNMKTMSPRTVRLLNRCGVLIQYERDSSGCHCGCELGPREVVYPISYSYVSM